MLYVKGKRHGRIILAVPYTALSFEGSQECIQCPERFWSNPDHTACVPQQIDFLSYNDTMGVILSIISVAGAILTSISIFVFFLYRHTPLVRCTVT